MIARHIFVIALLWYGLAVSRAADDPLINIMYRQEDDDVRYVWEIRQSYLASLPRCDPTREEVPISPHQAITAAAEFLKSKFPGTPSYGCSLFLNTRGLEPNPVAGELLMYEINFTYDPDIPHRPLHTVIVLMDGKVLVPSEQPPKPPTQ